MSCTSQTSPWTHWKSEKRIKDTQAYVWIRCQGSIKTHLRLMRWGKKAPLGVTAVQRSKAAVSNNVQTLKKKKNPNKCKAFFHEFLILSQTFQITHKSRSAGCLSRPAISLYREHWNCNHLHSFEKKKKEHYAYIWWTNTKHTAVS